MSPLSLMLPFRHFKPVSLVELTETQVAIYDYYDLWGLVGEWGGEGE